MAANLGGRFIHGTFTAYFHEGCRCEKCKTYQRDRNRASRADRLTSGRLNHGTRSAYDAGCRCADCSAARREAYHRLASEHPQKSVA